MIPESGTCGPKGMLILKFDVTAKFCTFLSGFQLHLYNGHHIP